MQTARRLILATERLRLMIPGPVDVEDDVLAALAGQVLPHYGKEWLAIYVETIECLKQVFGTRNDLFLMAGSGTAGLDAAMGSLMRSGDKILVPENGFFGRRLMNLMAASANCLSIWGASPTPFSGNLWP